MFTDLRSSWEIFISLPQITIKCPILDGFPAIEFTALLGILDSRGKCDRKRDEIPPTDGAGEIRHVCDEDVIVENVNDSGGIGEASEHTLSGIEAESVPIDKEVCGINCANAHTSEAKAIEEEPAFWESGVRAGRGNGSGGRDESPLTIANKSNL